MLKQINNLVYQLKLSETMQIHNVVSVMQFKSHSETDLYERESQLNSDSVEEQEDKQYYKINTVVNKKIIYESSQYKVK